MVLIKGCSNSFQDTHAPLSKDTQRRGGPRALCIPACVETGSPRKQSSVWCVPPAPRICSAARVRAACISPRSFHWLSFRLLLEPRHASFTVGEVSLALASIARDAECPIGKNSARKIIDANVRGEPRGRKNRREWPR